MAATAALLGAASRPAALGFVAAVLAGTLAFPALLVASHVYQARISGPWDEAAPSIPKELVARRLRALGAGRAVGAAGEAGAERHAGLRARGSCVDGAAGGRGEVEDGGMKGRGLDGASSGEGGKESAGGARGGVAAGQAGGGADDARPLKERLRPRARRRQA